MKNSLRTLLACAVLFNAGASAQGWHVGGSYLNLSDSESNSGLRLGALAVNVGYEFEMSDNFSIVPEFKLGTGINDDQVSNVFASVKVEVDRYTSLNAKMQYNFDNGAYAFAAPGWVNVDLSASSGLTSVSDDSTEFGADLGFGYKSDNNMSIELSFGKYDDADVIQLGARYHF